MGFRCTRRVLPFLRSFSDSIIKTTVTQYKNSHLQKLTTKKHKAKNSTSKNRWQKFFSYHFPLLFHTPPPYNSSINMFFRIVGWHNGSDASCHTHTQLSLPASCIKCPGKEQPQVTRSLPMTGGTRTEFLVPNSGYAQLLQFWESRRQIGRGLAPLLYTDK